MVGIAIASILVLGVLAQWLAWRLRVPSILMLLLTGLLVGPVAFGVSVHLLGRPAEEAIFLDIAGLFGEDLLLAMVSLAVGLILFEGALTLNFREIRRVRPAVLKLVTIGALVTWIVAALAARAILGLIWPVAILLGAILIVTGPTVIGPLLRFVRPVGSVGKVLKWEGIVIDPIGSEAKADVHEEVKGRTLFGKDYTYLRLVAMLAEGAQIGRTKLTREFTHRDWEQHAPGSRVPLFLVDETGALSVFAGDRPLTPRPGQAIIALSLPPIAGAPAERQTAQGTAPAGAAMPT